jgi:hypothetical protein
MQKLVEIRGDFEGAVDLPVIGAQIRSLSDAMRFADLRPTLAQNPNYRCCCATWPSPLNGDSNAPFDREVQWIVGSP